MATKRFKPSLAHHFDGIPSQSIYIRKSFSVCTVQCSTNAKSINIYNLKEDVWTMFQFRTLCNVAQTSAKWGQTLFEIVWRQKEKIKYEPANFEIFKTVTNFSPKTASVAQNQNLLVRQPFCKFKSETAFRLEIQFKVKSNIAKLAPAKQS